MQEQPTNTDPGLIKTIDDRIFHILPSFLKGQGFNLKKITDTPTDDLQVTNKKYVDDLINSISTPGSPEIFIPAECMNPTTTSGCAGLTKVEAATNDVDYWTLDFSTVTPESAFFTIRMPDNWDASTVTFQFIWTTAGGSASQTVDWGIKGRCYADDDAIDQAYGTEVITTDTRIANNDIHITTESSNVTIAGTLAAGNWCQFKITRKTATDNLSVDARLIGIRLKYGTV